MESEFVQFEREFGSAIFLKLVLSALHKLLVEKKLATVEELTASLKKEIEKHYGESGILSDTEPSKEDQIKLYRMFNNMGAEVNLTLQRMQELYIMIAKGKVGILDKFSLVERQLALTRNEAYQLLSRISDLWIFFQEEKAKCLVCNLPQAVCKCPIGG